MNPKLAENLHSICNRRNSGVPLYKRLTDCLSEMIISGALPNQFRFPPDSRMAEIFGVSHITWGRVFNELRQYGLVERSRQLGTFVSTPSAENGNGKNGKLVAVLFDDVSRTTFNSELFLALHEKLAENGFEMLFQSAAGRHAQQKRQLLDAMQNPSCCGCIIWSLLKESEIQEVMERKPSQWPAIFICDISGESKKPGYDLMHYDGFDGGNRIAERFLKHGGKRFLFAATAKHLEMRTIQVRIRGLWNAVSRHFTGTEPVRIITLDDSMAQFDALLDRTDDSLLIATAPKEMEMLCREAERRGVAMERLMPAIGFTVRNDAAASTRWLLPRLVFDPVKLGEAAVALLTKRYNGDVSNCKQILIKGDFDPKTIFMEKKDE